MIGGLTGVRDQARIGRAVRWQWCCLVYAVSFLRRVIFYGNPNTTVRRTIVLVIGSYPTGANQYPTQSGKARGDTQEPVVLARISFHSLVHNDWMIRRISLLR